MLEIEITNNNLSSIHANQSFRFECPNCKYTLIEKAWNYIHNYCPHCGAKINWNLEL